MERQELFERVQELMHERENLTREHEDLIKKDKLLTEQLAFILKELASDEQVQIKNPQLKSKQSVGSFCFEKRIAEYRVLLNTMFVQNNKKGDL